MPRGSGRYGGGGGGVGVGVGSRSRTRRDYSRHQEYVNKAAGSSASGGSWWTSGTSLRYDAGYDEYFMSMPLSRRCPMAMSWLEYNTKNGKKLSPTSLCHYGDLLIGCPEFEDLNQFAVKIEDEDSITKSSRCFAFTRAMDKVLLEEKNGLNDLKINFYKQWLDDCPNASEVHNS